MLRFRTLLAVLRGRVLAYEPDPYTDGTTPLMCRKQMCFGDRFCELPPNHAGVHRCRATPSRHGAMLRHDEPYDLVPPRASAPVATETRE